MMQFDGVFPHGCVSRLTPETGPLVQLTGQSQGYETQWFPRAGRAKILAAVRIRQNLAARAGSALPLDH